MSPTDTLIAKMETIERFNDGEIALSIEAITLTGLFNNFLRYLLDEWAVARVLEEDAPAVADRMLYYIRRPEGFRLSREVIAEIDQNGDRRIIPLLALRYLMHNRLLPVDVAHTTSEWSDFVSVYQYVIAEMGQGLIGDLDQ